MDLFREKSRKRWLFLLHTIMHVVPGKLPVHVHIIQTTHEHENGLTFSAQDSQSSVVCHWWQGD